MNSFIPTMLTVNGPAGAARSSKPLSKNTGNAQPIFDGSELNMFLHSVEIRAVRMAEIATGERAEALDLVQDAMLGLAEHYAAKPSTEWPALFHRLLQNRIRDWHRRRSVRKTWSWMAGQAADDFHAEQAAAEGEQPQKAAQQNAAIQELNKALQDLPNRQQQTFLLRAWEGLSVSETAAAMGCSEGSVKTQYSRATAKLRERLGAHWP